MSLNDDQILSSAFFCLDFFFFQSIFVCSTWAGADLTSRETATTTDCGWCFRRRKLLKSLH